MTPSYSTAVLGPSAPPLGNIFEDIGHGISNAAKGVVHAVEDAGKAVAHAAGDVLHVVGHLAPLAQIGLSFIPGIGQGISAVIGAGVALAEGKPITDALISAVKGAMPGGPLAAKAMELGVHGAIDVASGKSLDQAALNAVRSQLPGGDVARFAFDHGLALAHARNLQQSGVTSGKHLVPKTPDALRAWHATRTQIARQFAPSMLRPQARPTARPRPMARPAARPSIASPGTVPAAAPPAPAAPSDDSSSTVAWVGGALALALAGGGAWWWYAHNHRDH